MSAVDHLSARSLMAGEDLRWADFVATWTGIAAAIKADFEDEVCPDCDGDGYVITDGWRNGRHVDDRHRCHCSERDRDDEPTWRELGWSSIWSYR